jgi:type VII secretion-associated serine protease mycosin
MPRFTGRRWVAATAAVMVGFAATALWAGPAYADPVRQYEWYLDALKISQAHQITRGNGVRVAVLDTPVWANHRDLVGQVLQGTSIGAGPSNGWGDDVKTNSHGTGVAGAIAGKGGGNDRLLGIAPGAQILPVAVTADPADVDFKSAADGIRWAVDHGAQVINISAGHTGKALDSEVDAVRYALSKDVVVVAAAGNIAQGLPEVASPANIPGVVAVSGVDKVGNFWSGSASGPETVVAAPAVEMSVITVPSAYASGYALSNGTSFATAIVSGVVALIRAKYPQLNAANVINRLIKTSKDNGDPGRDKYFGFGTINPVGALTAEVPTVTENPLGGPSPSVAPSATRKHPSASKPRNTSARLAVVIAVPVVLVLGLVILLVVVVARSRRSRTAVPTVSYPAVPVQGHSPAGYPPGAPPGYPPGPAPPTGYGTPPPGYGAPPTGYGPPPAGYPGAAPPTTSWPGAPAGGPPPAGPPPGYGGPSPGDGR